MKTALAILVVVLAVMLQKGDAKRYCMVDDDCSDLGALSCIKSMCEYGICGCKRGYASRYLGHYDKFQCVLMKRVGEKCSTFGDHGVCGAENSHCDQLTGRCACDTGHMSVWGGERCSLSAGPSQGETCGTSLGSCSTSSCESTNSNTKWHHVVLGDTPTCACQNNERLRLVSSMYGESVSFHAHRVPVCYPARVGDSCLMNADCPGNSACGTDKKCACNTGLVPNYYRTHCDTALVFGTLCSAVTGHCDGSLGLVCGESCDLTEIPAASTCTCGPYHVKSGTTCSPILDGGSCYGDMNCKWFSDDGICVDGTCQEGAASLMVSLLLVLGLPVLNILYNI